MVLLQSKNQNPLNESKLKGFLEERGYVKVSENRVDDWKDHFLSTTITAKRVERKSEKQGE